MNNKNQIDNENAQNSNSGKGAVESDKNSAKDSTKDSTKNSTGNAEKTSNSNGNEQDCAD